MIRDTVFANSLFDIIPLHNNQSNTTETASAHVEDLPFTQVEIPPEFRLPEQVNIPSDTHDSDFELAMRLQNEEDNLYEEQVRMLTQEQNHRQQQTGRNPQLNTRQQNQQKQQNGDCSVM